MASLSIYFTKEQEAFVREKGGAEWLKGLVLAAMAQAEKAPEEKGPSRPEVRGPGLRKVWPGF